MNSNRNETKVKFIDEICVDTIANGEEQTMTLSIYECNECHWRFVGDCGRYGYGYDSEETQTPNYCPMCGKKISEEVE